MHNLSVPKGYSKGRPKGKFIATNAYIKNTERSQINNLLLHLQLLEKQEHVKPKTSKRTEKNKNKS
jgi:hypothetical protein